MVDTKTSDETAAGTLDGTELVRIVQSTNSRRCTAQEIADLAGRGLFRRSISATPTLSSTGLATWFNQGSASVADSDAGVLLTIPAESNLDRVRGRYKTAPSTPYTITALVGSVMFGNPVMAGIGWHDGTKVQEIDLRNSGAGWVIFVSSWTNSNTFSADNAGSVVAPANPLWLRLADNGTTVSFQYSADGVNFYTRYSVAKASGFLGSSGYSNILFFGNMKNGFTGNGLVTLMSYAEG